MFFWVSIAGVFLVAGAVLDELAVGAVLGCLVAGFLGFFSVAESLVAVGVLVVLVEGPKSVFSPTDKKAL